MQETKYINFDFGCRYTSSNIYNNSGLFTARRNKSKYKFHAHIYIYILAIQFTKTDRNRRF